MNLTNLNKLTQPINQIFLVTITSLILFFFTYISLKTFKAYDQLPTLGPIENTSKTPIKTGFFIRNFLDFDILKNEFVAEGAIWFLFDPKKISLEDISKFSIGKGEFLKDEFIKKPEAYTSTIDDKTFARFDIRIKFLSNLNYKLFPLDDHRLSITLNNKFINGKDFYFDINSNYFKISDTIYTPGWNKYRQDVKSGFSSQEITIDKNNLTFPRAIYEIDFQLINMRDVIFIFLPLLLIFFLSLFLFSLDPIKDREALVTLSSATIPAIFAYRFVIETITPKVSYFMLSDHIFNMFLIFAFLIFIISTFYLEKYKKNTGIIILTFHILLIISWAYLLFIWPII